MMNMYYYSRSMYWSTTISLHLDKDLLLFSALIFYWYSIVVTFAINSYPKNLNKTYCMFITMYASACRYKCQ